MKITQYLTFLLLALVAIGLCLALLSSKKGIEFLSPLSSLSPFKEITDR